MRLPLLVTSLHRNIALFDRDALVMQLVYFSCSIERKSFLFVKSFIFISDENGLMISETRECLFLVISGYLFENIFLKFGFFGNRVCDFVMMFTMNIINIFQILGFLA